MGRLRDRIRDWGSTPEERAAPWPCDAFVERPELALFRALDVDASVPVVFRWLCQLRVAPYSYDWIDNLGRRSPRSLTPGLERLAVGQRVMTIFELVAFAPDDHLTIRSDGPVFGPVAATYRVVARAGGGARIVVKLVARGRPGLRGALLRRLLPAGDWIMMRKQLRTLRALAEATARTRPAAPR